MTLELVILKSFISCYFSDLRPPYIIQLQDANITYLSIIIKIHHAFFIFGPVHGNLKVAIITYCQEFKVTHKADVLSILGVIHLPNVNEIHQAVLELFIMWQNNSLKPVHIFNSAL